MNKYILNFSIDDIIPQKKALTILKKLINKNNHSFYLLICFSVKNNQ